MVSNALADGLRRDVAIVYVAIPNRSVDDVALHHPSEPVLVVLVFVVVANEDLVLWYTVQRYLLALQISQILYVRDERRPRPLPRLLQQPAPAPLPRHENPGRIRYDGGDGCLTPNVQKVTDPPHPGHWRVQAPLAEGVDGLNAPSVRGVRSCRRTVLCGDVAGIRRFKVNHGRVRFLRVFLRSENGLRIPLRAFAIRFARFPTKTSYWSV